MYFLRTYRQFSQHGSHSTSYWNNVNYIPNEVSGIKLLWLNISKISTNFHYLVFVTQTSNQKIIISVFILKSYYHKDGKWVHRLPVEIKNDVHHVCIEILMSTFTNIIVFNVTNHLGILYHLENKQGPKEISQIYVRVTSIILDLNISSISLEVFCFSPWMFGDKYTRRVWGEMCKE